MTKPSSNPSLQAIAAIPEVKSAVLADLEGALAEAIAEPDAETIAAIMGFTIASVNKAGELLGLGPLARLNVIGPSRSCIATVRGDTVLTTVIDQGRSAGAVEEKLDTILQR